MSQVGTAPTVVGPGADAVWRRLRWPLLVLFVVLATAALVGLAGSGTARGALDPASAEPAGSRALATLLSDRGVPVTRVTSVSAAIDRAGGRVTLVIPFPDRVPTDRLGALAAAYAGDRLVLIAPGRDTLSALGSTAVPRDTAAVTRRDPRCGLPVAGAAGDADLGGRVYRPNDGTGCYPATGGATLVVGDGTRGTHLVVLGAGDPMENRRLDQHGNAALSLLLLAGEDSAGGSARDSISGSSVGTTRQVVWLMAGPGSAASGSPSLVDIAPRWLVLAIVQLLLASLVVAIWRGRRLGPPVTEPLPVLVRAAETVEGRARLYRRAGARSHAAEALRAGALARLVPRLGLGAEPSPAAVVAAVSARTGTAGTAGTAGTDRVDTGWLLFGPAPVDDAGLVRLADQLDIMVTAALATPTPPGPPRPPGAGPAPEQPGQAAHPNAKEDNQ